MQVHHKVSHPEADLTIKGLKNQEIKASKDQEATGSKVERIKCTWQLSMILGQASPVAHLYLPVARIYQFTGQMRLFKLQ